MTEVNGCKGEKGKWAHTSIAFSALVSWMTPMVAFATSMRRITRGSTSAPRREPPSCVSTRARTKETRADASKMRTSWSLNCSSTNSHKGVEGSSGSSTELRRNEVNNSHWHGRPQRERAHRLRHGFLCVLRLVKEKDRWWDRLGSVPGFGEALASKGGPCESQQLC
jgi:hypothetical protein